MSVNYCELCNRHILLDGYYEPTYPDGMICKYCNEENFKAMADFSPIVVKLKIIQQKWDTYSHEFINCVSDEHNQNPYDSEKDDTAVCWRLVREAIETPLEYRIWNMMMNAQYNACIRTPGEITYFELDKVITYFNFHINDELTQTYLNEMEILNKMGDFNLSCHSNNENQVFNGFAAMNL